ncbi:hypothetical protein C8R44DRAFT_778460, partial [Mycena epipterygia]
MIQRFQLHRLSLKLARIPANIRPNTHRGLPPNDIHDIAAVSKFFILTPSEFSLISTSLLPWMPAMTPETADLKHSILDDSPNYLPIDQIELFRGELGAPRLSLRNKRILVLLDALQAWEMRPFVLRLLEWLQDVNCPAFIVVDPIREVLRKGDDGEWADHLLRFLVEVSMPGQVRERARVEVERIAQLPTQSELENDAVETENDCLKKMDDWVDREKL